jgi:ankyrin repeat protein
MSSAPELPQELIQEFVIAAHNNSNLPKIQALLEKTPALLDAKDPKGDETALAAASHTGQKQIVEYLLSKGALLTIWTAAMLGMKDRVADFLTDDASLAHTPGSHGISLVFHAAISGDTELTELLLARGSTTGMDEALAPALMFNHPLMVRWLLDHGANVNAPQQVFQNNTALAAAIRFGRQEMVDLLLQYGGTP